MNKDGNRGEKMMTEKNENQELLDWAVTNLELWGYNYHYLFSDDSYYPLFFGSGAGWRKGDDGAWVNDCHEGNSYLSLSLTFSTLTPQVITKEQWLEAKELKKQSTTQQEEGEVKQEFTKSDLVAGKHVVETREGLKYTLLENFLKSVEGVEYLFIFDYSEDLLEFDRDDERLDIVKVYKVSQIEGYFGFTESLHLIWERGSEEKAKLRKEKEELEARLQEINKELGGGV